MIAACRFQVTILKDIIPMDAIPMTKSLLNTEHDKNDGKYTDSDPNLNPIPIPNPDPDPKSHLPELNFSALRPSEQCPSE